MMFTTATLRACMELAERVGKITSVHMYDENLITVKATAGDGKEFSITMSVQEEEKDGD